MYFEEENILNNLDDLFEDLDIEKPTEEQMFKLYGIFLNDFVKNPIFINTSKLEFDNSKSKHPIFKNKFKSFEHICTRESKYSGKRTFDKERANKIHWIKIILENSNDNRIKYFEKVHYSGKNQRFYWYEDKKYIVIIREISTSIRLITAFSVDELERNKFKRMYNEYRK